MVILPANKPGFFPGSPFNTAFQNTGIESPIAPEASDTASKRETIYLVSCSASKMDHRAPAGDLYTGKLFKLSRKIAASGDRWFILSAKHKLLFPEEEIDPYDQRLPKEKGALNSWGSGAANRLLDEVKPGQGSTIVFLAPEAYRTPIIRYLKYKRKDLIIETPLAGLPIGKQQAYLKTQIPAEPLPAISESNAPAAPRLLFGFVKIGVTAEVVVYRDSALRLDRRDMPDGSCSTYKHDSSGECFCLTGDSTIAQRRAVMDRLQALLLADPQARAVLVERDRNSKESTRG